MRKTENSSKNHLFIIVNTLDSTYYEKVVTLCESLNLNKFIKKIIQTKSNGKPGMGHNSVIKSFCKNDYNYLLMIDGDDFLYPYALFNLQFYFEIWFLNYDFREKLGTCKETSNKIIGNLKN